MLKEADLDRLGSDAVEMLCGFLKERCPTEEDVRRASVALSVLQMYGSLVVPDVMGKSAFGSED